MHFVHEKDQKPGDGALLPEPVTGGWGGGGGGTIPLEKKTK